MLNEAQYKDVIVHLAWKSMIEHQMLTNQQTQLQSLAQRIEQLTPAPPADNPPEQGA